MKQTDLIILTLCIVAALMGAGLGKARSTPPPAGIAPLQGPSR